MVFGRVAPLGMVGHAKAPLMPVAPVASGGIVKKYLGVDLAKLASGQMPMVKRVRLAKTN